MSSHNAILAATDFSAPARHAADRAARLAQESGAPLTLMHVVPGKAFAELREWLGPDDATQQRVQDDARQGLQALAAELQARRQVAVRTVHTCGSVLDDVLIEARALAAGQLDLAIDVALPASEPVRHAVLLQQGFCIAVRSRHALKRRPTLPQYLQAPHVAVSSRASGAVVEDIALLNLGLQRRIALRCQDYQAACRVVAGSDHLLTLPTGLARQMAGRSLRLLPLPFELPPIQPHLYWHANLAVDPANQWLRQLVVDACRTLDGGTG